MVRSGFVLLLLFLLSCKGKKGGSSNEETGFSYEAFSAQFPSAALPYQLSDTSLAKSRDTASIHDQYFAGMVPDSVNAKWFGKGNKVKYFPIARFNADKSSNYFLVKSASASRKGAFLFVFSKSQLQAVFPFLLPDSDPSTSQSAVLDKSYSIIKNVIQKKPGNVAAEGKDVFVYNPAAKNFSLILTNPIDNGHADIINPIDTFPRRHKFSGDYVKDKRNFVSVRDGRYPNQLVVFIHREFGECSGELKGDVLLTSATAAMYRQGGDPCMLNLRFDNSAVTLKEEGGCGSHRGLDCTFDGVFPRKKEARPRPAAKSKSRKS